MPAHKPKKIGTRRSQTAAERDATPRAHRKKSPSPRKSPAVRKGTTHRTTAAIQYRVTERKAAAKKRR